MLKKLFLLLLLPALCFGQDSATGTQPEVNKLEQVLLHAPKSYETGFTDARKTFMPAKWITLDYAHDTGISIPNPFPDKKGIISELIIEGIKNEGDMMTEIQVYLYALDPGSNIVINILSKSLFIEVPKGTNKLRINITNRGVKFPKNGIILALKPIKNTGEILLRLGKTKESHRTSSYGIRDPYPKELPFFGKGNFTPMVGVSIKEY